MGDGINYNKTYYNAEISYLKKANNYKNDIGRKISACDTAAKELLSSYDRLRKYIASTDKAGKKYVDIKIEYISTIFKNLKLNELKELYRGINELSKMLKSYANEVEVYDESKNGNSGNGGKKGKSKGKTTKSKSTKKSKSKFYKKLELVSAPTKAKKVSSAKSYVISTAAGTYLVTPATKIKVTGVTSTPIPGVTPIDMKTPATTVKVYGVATTDKGAEAIKKIADSAKSNSSDSAKANAKVAAEAADAAEKKAIEQQKLEEQARLENERRQQEAQNTSQTEQQNVQTPQQQSSNNNVSNTTQVSRNSYNYSSSNNDSSAENSVQEAPVQESPVTENTDVVTSEEDISPVEEDTVIIDDETSKVTSSHGKSRSGSIVPGVLGVAAAGAATVAGVRYIKNKDKDNYEVDDYEEDGYDDDSYTAVSNNNDEQQPVEKYKANSLNLDDVDDIKIEDDYDDDFNQELE